MFDYRVVADLPAATLPAVRARRCRPMCWRLHLRTAIRYPFLSPQVSRACFGAGLFTGACSGSSGKYLMGNPDVPCASFSWQAGVRS